MSGSRTSLTTPIFSCVRVVRIEIGVTSDPVPAVVGTRINGNRAPVTFPTPYICAKG